MPTLSANIADWIGRTSLSALPGEIVDGTRLRILDLVGVMLASGANPLVQSARRAVLDSEGSGTGASALGLCEDLAPATAAFLNGIMAAVLEYDDTYIPTTIHPTGACLSAVFPRCMSGPVPGARVIEAVALGSELMCRMSIVPPIRWFDFGIHPTGVFGIFGGVAALSRVLGMTRQETVDAFGAAGSMSGGLTAAFADGTATKTMHVGFAAANAVRATALARQGISGPATVLEGKTGWYAMHVQTTDARDYDLLDSGLGQRWESRALATKFYPTAFPLMPQIETALEMREKFGIDPSQIETIDAYIIERSFANLCEPVEVKRRPSSTWHGRISLQHTIAEALVRGRMDKDAYSETAILDPQINALADKVRHRRDDEGAKDYSRSGARIVIRMKTGKVLDHAVGDMRGTERNPVTSEDYLAKFHSNVCDLLPRDLAEEVAESLLRLETLDDTGALLQRLRSVHSQGR